MQTNCYNACCNYCVDLIASFRKNHYLLNFRRANETGWSLLTPAGVLNLVKDHKRKSFFIILHSIVPSQPALWSQEIYRFARHIFCQFGTRIYFRRCKFTQDGTFIQFSGENNQVRDLYFKNYTEFILLVVLYLNNISISLLA